MRDCPCCQGQIRVLNSMLGFCRKSFHIGRTNHILCCDMVAHAIQSVLQRALMVMNPVAIFLSYLHMYYNGYEGPKACLGPQHCSQSVIHGPF
jgi:hypothetical protein